MNTTRTPRAGLAALTALALTGATATAALMLHAGTPAQAARDASAPASAPSRVSAWGVPSSSVHADAATIIDSANPDAGDHTRLRVVVVSKNHADADVSVTPVVGTRAAAAAIENAQGDPDTLAVSVDTPVSLLDTTTATRSNDTYRTRQWALDTLHAEQTWAVTQGAGAVVGVIDTGVDANHPDLAGRVLPGTDLVAGSGDGGTDPNGHGTHVAGIIAADANNGIGTAGLAPQAKILPVRVLAADGTGWNSDVANGIIWATDHGANIISMSLGGTSDSATQAAVKYAVDHNVVVVAAAGNERQQGNPVSYPAAYPGVIGVAATTVDNTSASFSNTGSYVDVAAPGVNIFSTVPSGYEYMSGTSMATPYAAAAAALAYSASGGQATAAQIDSALTASATDLGAAGRDDEFGYGLIDPTKVACTFTLCDNTPATPTTPTLPAPSPTPSLPAPSPVTTSPQAPSPATPTPTPTLSGPDPVRFVTAPAIAYRYAGGLGVVHARLVDTLTGDPVADARVNVRGRRGRHLVVSRWLTTNSNGAFTARYLLNRTTRFVVVHPADASYGYARAFVATYRVMPSVQASYQRRTATISVFPQVGQRVWFQRRTHGHWVTRRRVRLNGYGQAVARRLRAGEWRMHVTAARGLVPVTTATFTTGR